MEIHQSLTKSTTGIRNVLCRHEQGEVFAAEGYAKCTGRLCHILSLPRHQLAMSSFCHVVAVFAALSREEEAAIAYVYTGTRQASSAGTNDGTGQEGASSV
jgi:hypothetical protein